MDFLFVAILSPKTANLEMDEIRKKIFFMPVLSANCRNWESCGEIMERLAYNC